MNRRRAKSSVSFVVAQLGARMHYAVPRMLYSAGALEHFFADICAAKGWPRMLHFVPTALRPRALRRLLGRVPEGLPPSRMTVFTSLGWRYTRRLSQARSRSETTDVHLWAGRRFCEEVARRGWGDATGVYTFNGAGLEILREARKRSVLGVLEQTIAPRQIQLDLLRQEHAAHPSWSCSSGSDSDAHEAIQRERAEWEEADVIVCGSDFVRDSIAACGGPADRCKVVPYGVDIHRNRPRTPHHTGPLRVLTVGTVGLRKGSPYVFEAASQLVGVAEFRLVGPIEPSPHALVLPGKHVHLMGPVPRSEMSCQYRWADVFLLPSICEGSATAVYEALAAGVPVICTPNTGSVVRDGVDGFVVPTRDADAIVARLKELANRPSMLEEMSAHAFQRACEFTLDAYKDRLLDALSCRSRFDMSPFVPRKIAPSRRERRQ